MVKVLKSGEVTYPVGRPVVLTVNNNVRNTADTEREEKLAAIGERERQAEMIIRKAYSEEKRIIEEARAKAESIMKKAEEKAAEIYAKAKEEGFTTGRDEACSLIKEAESKASGITGSAQLERQNILNSLSKEIIDLSFNIAEKILSYELDRNGKAYASIINSAISKAEDKDVTVLINEDEYMRHYSVLSEDTRIKPDDSLREGEIRVLSKRGIIDASIDKQLEKAKLVAGVGI